MEGYPETQESGTTEPEGKPPHQRLAALREASLAELECCNVRAPISAAGGPAQMSSGASVLLLLFNSSPFCFSQ